VTDPGDSLDWPTYPEARAQEGPGAVRRPVRGLRGLLAVVVLTALGIGSASADPPVLPDTDLRAEADALFKHLLAKPNDLDAAFRFSEIETKLGDYEAAIGALERMLFYNPNLPRVKLELGLLYFKLHSYEMAKSYFNAAIASPDTPQDVRDEVAKFLSAIDRGLSVNPFSVFAQIGMRHQSNANAGPDSQVVRALGQDAVLSSQFKRTPDWNAFGIVSAHHFYDFGNQRGDGWESDLISYYARQFKVTRLDLGLIELATGPRLTLDAARGTSIHPYVLANYVTLGDHPYLGTLGAGVSLRFELPAGITLDPGVEYRDRTYSNSKDYETATLQDGRQIIGYVGGSGPLPMLEGLTWQGRITYSKATASYHPYAYDDFTAEFALPYSFTAPAFAQTEQSWTVAPFVGFSFTPYAEPDPLIDPSITRLDRQWRAGATLDMIFYKNFGFAIQVQYMQTISTVPNYRLRDLIFSGGPTIRF
jgi:tetratricopeptide (TPR) repeat protein